jgi:hypothetical protein
MSSPGYGSGICSLLCMPACKAKIQTQTNNASESGQKQKAAVLGVWVCRKEIKANGRDAVKHLGATRGNPFLFERNVCIGPA